MACSPVTRSKVWNAVDATHVWVVADSSAGAAGSGESVRILASSNGGSTWVQQPVTGGLTGYIRGIEFVDRYNGWSFAATFSPSFAGVILHTTNGGASWTRQTTAVRSKPWDVFALDLNHVWFSGYENNVTVRTADGGATWKTFSEGYAGEERTRLAFTSTVNGWAAAGGGLYRTIDGGATWQPFLDNIGIMTGIDAVDASHVWAVGWIGTGGIIRSLKVPTTCLQSPPFLPPLPRLPVAPP